MYAEIIAVGSELLTPSKTDTNSLWLTERLNAMGLEVTQKSILGDDRDRLSTAIRAAMDRTPVVILTGGLGPTEDDVTREATAQALMRRLLFDPAVCKVIEDRFASRGRKMAETNKRQAFVIEGAEVLPNPNGTAPGLWLDLPGRMLMLLPGPPSELKPLFKAECEPRLRERLPESFIRTRWYRVAGMGESDLDALIAPIYKPVTEVATTILAAAGDVQIHLRAQQGDADAAERLVAELGDRIQEALGDRIYSSDGAPLEAAIGQLLRDSGETLCVAESCTAGLLGGRITDVPGSSQWFLGGFQVYGTPMKTRLLGLDEAMVDREGVVSEAVACAMADSARDRTGATYALSITGEAGPDSATAGIAPGTVWIGLSSAGSLEAKVFRFPGGRSLVRTFAVQTALNLLRLHLCKRTN